MLPRLRVRNTETVYEPWRMCQLMTGEVSFQCLLMASGEAIGGAAWGSRHKPAISRAEATGLEDGPKPRSDLERRD